MSNANPLREPLTDDEREEISLERADHWQDTKADREGDVSLRHAVQQAKVIDHMLNQIFPTL